MSSWLMMISLTVGLFLLTASPVRATSFTVGNAAELIQAIHDANDETANPGVDTITLTADITLTAVDNNADIDNDGLNDDPNGLPVITSEIVLEGAGFSLLRDDAAGTPQFRILAVTTGSTTGTLTVRNLTIQNGYADAVSSTSAGRGGGIVNRGNLTVINSTFQQNSADLQGGGIANLDGNVTVINSHFSQNSVGTGGGGIYNGSGTMTLENTTVSSNGGAGSGKGIYNASGTLIIRNSLITDNGFTGGGGGIYNTGTLTVENSTISNNQASNGGGIASGPGGNITLENSTISGNQASEGGGLFISETSLTLINSTVSGNSSSNATGVYNLQGDVTLQNSTLAANTGSGANNAAIRQAAYTSKSATLTLRNSIVHNPGSPINYNSTGSSTSSVVIQGSNIVGDLSIQGTRVDNVNPLLASLADNGGPTQTHALQFASPAINEAGTGATAFDQRGASATPRVPGGSPEDNRDIGAYESQSAAPSVSFSIDETALTEGGAITQATVTMTPQNYRQPFDVRFVFTGNITDDDYSTTYSNPITITSSTPQTFTINITDDMLDEPDETLSLELLLVGTAGISSTNPQAITFIDNDGTGADVNGDGIVSPSDAIYVLNRLGSNDLSADVNGDNLVDTTDYDDVMTALGTSVP